MSNECSYANIMTSQNKCEFVKSNCDFSYIDFYAIHYCYFDSIIFLSLPLYFVVGIIS